MTDRLKGMFGSKNAKSGTLYWFPLSIWASFPMLALYEKGYLDDVTLESIDVPNGGNFAPDFLKLNKEGTVPVFVDHKKNQVIVGSTQCFDYIDTTFKSSRSSHPISLQAVGDKKASQDFFTNLIHSAVDSNFLLLSARTREELAQKNAGFPGDFLRGRQKALTQYAAEARDPELKKFYDAKLESNTGVLALFEGKADPDGFIQASIDALGFYIFLHSVADSTDANPYLLGSQFTSADVHVGAYIARVILISGHSDINKVEEALTSLEAQMPKEGPLQGAIPEKIKTLWRNYSARKSFKDFYGQYGLH
ncbi:hypothetical protein BT69DRAFT_1244888 [Atractiella rhizophila]|nr:hypothetical protein BT69DRAFT_1268813 [Atractiella rhizophila]KAH8920814.1 hypothetical protein BT69DRAFT_1244888 [Atractiella rhizophila]